MTEGTTKGPVNDVFDEEAAFGQIQSFSKTIWTRFKRHRLATLGIYVLGVLVLCAVLAPLIAPYDPTYMDIDKVSFGKPLPPSREHWFGTDPLGRDWLSRSLYGARISLSVGLVAVGISVTIGSVVGAVAGYYGGVVDTVICRIIDVLMCVPTFFLILTVNAFLKPSIFNVMVIIGIFGWMGTARLVRGQILSIREQEFVEASVALGLSDWSIITKDVLPNVFAQLIVTATTGIAGAIMTESALSYLGMGVQEPFPSWGAMLKSAQDHLLTAPWLAIFPGILISITVLSINFVGDGLRDAIDPRLKQ
ncbi:MAG: oligopeptide ABC transporter permease [Bacillota bacterium]